MSHAYTVLEISSAAYNEIAEKLRAAGYDHAFHYQEVGRPLIDMHGLAVAADGPTPVKPVTEETWARAPEDQQPLDWRHSLEHTDEHQILLCRTHDLGLCGKHRKDCLGTEEFPCHFVSWRMPEHNPPWCAICEGRLLPQKKESDQQEPDCPVAPV